MLKTIALAVTMVAVAAPLTAASAQTAPIQTAPTEATPADTLDWRPCPDTGKGKTVKGETGKDAWLECADIRVPVDWSKPNGRTITLRLGRLPSTSRAEGSVLVAYGGPGGPGIDITRSHSEMWTKLRARMHVVTWDTRGYGEQSGGTSTGLPCTWTRIPLAELPRGDAAFGRLSATNRSYAEACRRNDPELFTT